MRSKTWISAAQFLECAHEKSRPHQQYQRQRYLRDDQAPAEPTSSFSRCARAMQEGHGGIFSTRTAISWLRDAPRASIKLARLTHATRRTRQEMASTM